MQRIDIEQEGTRKGWNLSTTLAILVGSSLLLEGLLFAQFMVPSHDAYFFEHDPVGGDFINYWAASVLNSHDRIQEIFDYQKFHQAQTVLLGHEYQLRIWSYPPHFLFYLVPLSWMPYQLAYILWNAVTFGMFALAMWLNGIRTSSIMVLLVAPATFVNVLTGQNGFLSGALFIGGLLCIREYPVVAGVLLGLLSYKPHLGILIPVVLLAMRLWKPLVSAGITMIALVLMSLVVHGPEVWRLYFTVTSQNNTAVLESGTGFLTYMMPTVFMSGRILDMDVGIIYVVQFMVLAMVMIGTYWGIRHCEHRSLQVATVSIAIFLASPYAHNYDMTILSAAIVLILFHTDNHGFLPGENVVLGLAWFLPIGVILLNALGFPISPLLLGALFVWLLLRIRRLSKAEPRWSQVVKGQHVVGVESVR